MRMALTQKFINVTPPAAINDNTAFTTGAVDMQGWRHATFLIILGATDIAVAALKLTESEASDMTGATDVPGADFSVAPATLPADTDDNTIFAIHCRSLGKRKRYLDLSFTAGNGTLGTFASVIAVLSDPEIFPVSAADRGLAAELTV